MDIPEGKHLGKLCIRGHDWNGTGKSLKYNSGDCCACHKIFQKKYNDAHKNEAKEYYQKYKEEKKERYKEKKLIYAKTHKANFREYLRKYNKLKYRTDIRFRLNCCVSASVRDSLKGRKNGKKWEHLIGYNLNELKNHLERTMPIGYTWDDYLEGKLHIDHIIPVNAFNFNSPMHIDFRRCWALSNLRLLPAKDNILKRDKLDKDFQPSFAL